MKRLVVLGTAVLLSACGGEVVHAPAPLGDLVKPGTAPWLTVAGGADKLEVRGLDHKLILEPSPAVAAAVQSQLGAQLQPDYFPDLVVTCTSLDTELHVNEKKAPGELGLDMTVQCSVWSRGFDTNHNYKAAVSAAVGAGGSDPGYAQTLPTLLADGANEIAAQLRADLQKSAHGKR
jgi:hypothetical protein